MTDNQGTLRRSTIRRRTDETTVEMRLDLDGQGDVQVQTGVLFLNHMLHAFGHHARLDLTVTAAGDAAMDAHHTVEDVGIVLGQAIRASLGTMAGIDRFGSGYAPLDEALARVVIDCSGRPYLEYTATMPEPSIGPDFASSLVEEFWRAVATNGGLSMHIDLLRARNAHHAAEAIFKAAAVAFRAAISRTLQNSRIPSTKGMLG